MVFNPFQAVPAVIQNLTTRGGFNSRTVHKDMKKYLYILLVLGVVIFIPKVNAAQISQNIFDTVDTRVTGGSNSTGNVEQVLNTASGTLPTDPFTDVYVYMAAATTTFSSAQLALWTTKCNASAYTEPTLIGGTTSDVTTIATGTVNGLNLVDFHFSSPQTFSPTNCNMFEFSAGQAEGYNFYIRGSGVDSDYPGGYLVAGNNGNVKDLYFTLSGSTTDSIAIRYPVNGGDTPDPKNWVIDTSGIKENGTIDVWYATLGTPFDNYSHDNFIQYSFSSSVTAVIPKLVRFPDSTTTWSAFARFSDSDDNIKAFSPIVNFTVHASATVVHTAITDLAGVGNTAISGVTPFAQGGVVFNIPDCDGSATSGSSTLSMWRCNIEAGLKSLVNDFASSFKSLTAGILDLRTKIFPFNIYNSIDQDFETVLNTPTSTETIVLKDTSTTNFFYGHQFTLLTANTLTDFGNNIGLDIRGLISKIIYAFLGLIIVLIAFETIKHFRESHTK